MCTLIEFLLMLRTHLCTTAEASSTQIENYFRRRRTLDFRQM